MSDDAPDDLYLLAGQADALADRLLRRWGDVWDARWNTAGPPSPHERRLLALQHRAERRLERRQARLEAGVEAA